MGSVQAFQPTPRPATLPAARRTLRRCLVCGFAEVRTDEVVDRGILLLASCPRCDHRWTEPLAAEAAPRRVESGPRPVRRAPHGGEGRPAA